MGNLQGIPATPCDDRIKNPMNGKVSTESGSVLKMKCEGYNPANIGKALYPSGNLYQYKQFDGKRFNGIQINSTASDRILNLNPEQCATQCSSLKSPHQCSAFTVTSDGVCTMYQAADTSMNGLQSKLVDQSGSNTYLLDTNALQFHKSVPSWLKSEYQSYPTQGKPGDYVCKYNPAKRSCTGTQIPCDRVQKNGKTMLRKSAPSKKGGSIKLGSGSMGTVNAANQIPKVRINNQPFYQCQTYLGTDHANCIHDVYTVGAFGLPLSQNSRDNPLYKKRYQFVDSRVPIACPNGWKFGAGGEEVGCVNPDQTTVCTPIFNPYSPAETGLSTCSDVSTLQNMYIYPIGATDTDPSFVSTDYNCDQVCWKNDECTGFTSYLEPDGTQRCVMYKQSSSDLKAQSYDTGDSTNQTFYKTKPESLMLEPPANLLPSTVAYTALTGPPVDCPIGSIRSYSNGIALCTYSDYQCRPRNDFYSVASDLPPVCTDYSTSDTYKSFYASNSIGFPVLNQESCQSTCDRDPNCTAYSSLPVTGGQLCTTYSLPPDQIITTTLPTGAGGSVSMMKTRGQCPGTMVQDRHGNCVIPFKSRRLGDPQSGVMSGIALGGGLKRDPRIQRRSGTSYIGMY